MNCEINTLGRRREQQGRRLLENKTRGEKQSRRQDVEWKAGLEELTLAIV